MVEVVKGLRGVDQAVAEVEARVVLKRKSVESVFHVSTLSVELRYILQSCTIHIITKAIHCGSIVQILSYSTPSPSR